MYYNFSLTFFFLFLIKNHITVMHRVLTHKKHLNRQILAGYTYMRSSNKKYIFSPHNIRQLVGEIVIIIVKMITMPKKGK